MKRFGRAVWLIFTIVTGVGYREHHGEPDGGPPTEEIPVIPGLWRSDVDAGPPESAI
jgi:hypothetical protein